METVSASEGLPPWHSTHVGVILLLSRKQGAISNSSLLLKYTYVLKHRARSPGWSHLILLQKTKKKYKINNIILSLDWEEVLLWVLLLQVTESQLRLS